MRALTLVAIFAFAGSSAVAQTPASAGPSDCEFHVWPAKQTLAVVEYDAVFPAGRDKPWIDPRKPTPHPLSAARQAELMATVDLPSLFGVKGARTIVHPEPLDRLAAREPVRHTETASACTYELAINSFIYESKIYSSRSLRLVASFRKFEVGQSAPSITYNSSAATKLNIYPARKVEDVGPAMEELEGAYLTSLQTFAAYQQKNAAVRH